MSEAERLARRTLSDRFWQVGWEREMPWDFDGYRVTHGTYEQAEPFLREHYTGIFGDQKLEGRFLAERMTDAKQRFCAETDFLLIEEKASSQVLGLVIGHPTDWSTWYCRTFAIAPALRDKHVANDVMERIFDILTRAGVERIETDVAPANVVTMVMLQKRGFVPAGTLTSERWGVMTRLCKFLVPAAQEIFVRQFCVVPNNRPRFDEPRGKNPKGVAP